MKALIMAGGKGTRLANVTHNEIPKPMIPICGKPLMQYHIELLARYGITDIVIVAGPLHHIIQNHFGDGRRFGVSIQYYIESYPMGSAGALQYLQESLSERFFLLFGDLMIDVSLPKMLDYHLSSGAKATLFAHPNSHPYDSDLLTVEKNGQISGFLKKNLERKDYYRNLVNAGMYILEPSCMKDLPESKKLDLETDLLFPMVDNKEAVYAYQSPEYIRDAGTPNRLEQVQQDVFSGIVSAKNLDNPQPCIFLDRDGTVNHYNGLVSSPEQFELYDMAAQAIREINQSGLLAIVVTNQPVVARGMCQEEDVQKIHNKMETLLGQHGAFVDDIIFCPHHPHKGYKGENPAYKIPCECRKPAIGMIRFCEDRYHIDPNASWMIGDTTVDIQTGKNAGMKTVLVQTGLSGSDKKYDVYPDYFARDLLEAIKIIQRR